MHVHGAFTCMWLFLCKQAMSLLAVIVSDFKFGLRFFNIYRYQLEGGCMRFSLLDKLCGFIILGGQGFPL